MQIKTIVSSTLDENCYLLVKENKGILIDPGLDTFAILKETEGIEINYALITHCHFDHIYSLKELSKTIVGSVLCSENITDTNITLMRKEDGFCRPCDVIIKDGETLNLDGFSVKCIYTPGHTSGSACFLIENCLFSGDTLFFESVGRTDFPTGDEKTLKKSIREKLYTLPDETVVYPGHGKKTTIGYEKKNNLYVREDSKWN